MFERILFPTDFSAYANAVLACLPELRAAGLREVVLLHVIPSSEVPMPETFNRESAEQVRLSVEEHLKLGRRALEGQGLRVMTSVEFGSPAAQIVRVAEDQRASLIVIGAQGSTVAEELLLGSVASEVLRRATVPVLLQRSDVVRELGHIECRRVCGQTFARVLHPTDFSDCANEAFQVVKRLKAAGTQEVILLHVQDERSFQHRSTEQWAGSDRVDSERLDKLCRALVLFGMQARAVGRRGIPFRETLQVAEEEAVGLIVLGSYGHSAIQELLVGSTFENVARLSRQPVLVVRCRADARPA
jgi:nucleotide-binding universal stress UspA family protein